MLCNEQEAHKHIELIKIVHNKSNTECDIIRPTDAIYMGSYSLLGSNLSRVLKY